MRLPSEKRTMKFLRKIEAVQDGEADAIHPRGRGRDTSGLVNRFDIRTEKAGRTLLEKMDFLGEAVQELIDDYDFSDTMNKRFHRLKSANSLGHGDMKLSVKVSAALTFMDTLAKVMVDLTKLYQEGKLKAGVDKEHLHRFLDLGKEVLGEKEKLQKMYAELNAVGGKLEKMGFT